MLTKTVEPIEKQLSQSYLKSLPFGQRMLRAGFKMVKRKDLEDRLGVTCYNKKQKDRSRQKAQRICDLLNKKRKENIFVRTIWRDRKNKYFTHKEYGENGIYYEVGYKGYCYPLCYSRKRRRGEKYYYYKTNLIEIKFEALGKYIGDIIPDRCIESIKEARKLGCKHFHVVTTQEKVYDDPIIIATEKQKLEEPYFEIDMWE